MYIRFVLSNFFAAALLTLSPVYALAQEEQTKPISVYEASTVASELPVTRTLSLEEFSTYAGEMCKKYGLEGPTEISSPSDRTQLYSEMSAARKVLFKQLCDPKIREDAAAKEKVQAQMKSLSQDLSYFPNLAGFGTVDIQPRLKERIQDLRQLAAPGLQNNLSDSIPTVRDQIKQKHGKYYVPLVPNK